MEGTANVTFESNSLAARFEDSQAALNAKIIQDTFRSSSGADTVDTSFGDLTKSLTVSAQEIVAKLNEYLKDSLPGGIESIKPEDATPEATADRIVTGVVALYDVFTKQHADLSPEEVLTQFLSLARKGVDQGYGEAHDILDGLGAFQFEGVEDGIATTKKLVEEKLAAFETQKRKELGLSNDSLAGDVSKVVTDQVTTQAGKGMSLVA